MKNYNIRIKNLSVPLATITQATYRERTSTNFKSVIGGPIVTRLVDKLKKNYDFIGADDAYELLVSKRVVEFCREHHFGGVIFVPTECINATIPWDYHMIVPNLAIEVDLDSFCGEYLKIDQFGKANDPNLFVRAPRTIMPIKPITNSFFVTSNIQLRSIYCTSDVAEKLAKQKFTNLDLRPAFKNL